MTYRRGHYDILVTILILFARSFIIFLPIIVIFYIMNAVPCMSSFLDYANMQVEPLSSFRHAAAEAVAVTGLRPLACEGQWRPGQHCPSAIGWGA